MAVAKRAAANAPPIGGDAPLLAHLAQGPHIEGPEHILNTIRDSQDEATLSWAAAALTCHLHEAPDRVPASAMDTLATCLWRIASSSGGQVAGRRGTLRTEPKPLGGLQQETASALLAALLELARERPEDVEHLRMLLWGEGEGTSDWLAALLNVMADATHVDRGGAAFVHACHLLAVLVDGNEDLAKKLLAARTLDLVGGRLLRASAAPAAFEAEDPLGGRAHDGSKHKCDIMGTEWLPFATAAVLLIGVLVAEEDVERWKLAEPGLHRPVWVRGQRPDIVVDGLLAALKRSLLHDRGSMVAQPLHISGLRALGRIAYLSSAQAHRMIVAKALELGVKALSIQGTDEEALLVFLWFLAEVSSSSPSAHKHLAALGTVEIVQRIAARYPRSKAVSCETARVLLACKDSRA